MIKTFTCRYCFTSIAEEGDECDSSPTGVHRPKAYHLPGEHEQQKHAGDDSPQVADKPLPERKFWGMEGGRYYVHVDVRGFTTGQSEANIAKIIAEGFKSNRVNALPAQRKALDVLSARYAPRKGDVVYLVPREWIKQTGNGPMVKPGWRPKSYEVLKISDPSKSLYDYYLEGFKTGR